MAAFESWIDRQIREAIERGEFDNLPGAGKPLRGLGDRRDDDWWIKQKLERENVTPPLPTSLALRREARGIYDTVASLRTEAEVREAVDDLNARIREGYRRGMDGPPIVVPLLDADDVVREWRAARAG
jgi:hypothetical protein